MKIGRACRLVAGIAGVALASCTGATTPLRAPRSPVPPPSSREVVVIGTTFDGPKACQPREAAGLVQDFLAAISQGDDAAVAAILTPEPRFMWYSASLDLRNHAAFDVAETRTLLQRRAEAHEEGLLLALSVQFDPRRRLGHIAYALSLRADDVQPAADGSDRLVEGKGAIDCATGTIMVWSMGTDARRTTIADLPPYCPGAHQLGDEIVACAT